MDINTVGVECPYCHSANQFRKTGFFGMEKVQCSHCSKKWEANLEILASSPVLSKSAPESEVRAFIAQTKAQIETLTKRITDLLNQRVAASRFNPVSKDDAAREELQKALANPRRGFGNNPFEGEGTDRPKFQPQESVTVVGSGAASDAAGEPTVRKRSKFEPLAR